MTYRCIECWEYFTAETKSTWRKCERCKAKTMIDKNFEDNFYRSRETYKRTGKWVIAQGSFAKKEVVDKARLI